MRNEIEQRIIKLAKNNQGIVFMLLAALSMASVCLLIYGIIILSNEI